MACEGVITPAEEKNFATRFANIASEGPTATGELFSLVKIPINYGSQRNKDPHISQSVREVKNVRFDKFNKLSIIILPGAYLFFAYELSRPSTGLSKMLGPKVPGLLSSKIFCLASLPPSTGYRVDGYDASSQNF